MLHEAHCDAHLFDRAFITRLFAADVLHAEIPKPLEVSSSDIYENNMPPIRRVVLE